jgi:hypothetical protein
MCVRLFQNALNREQSLRHARAHAFVNRATPQRHGHRRSLVGAGVEVLAIDQNHNGDKPGLTVGHLNQAQRAWALVDLRAGILRRRAREHHQSQSGRDDEPPGPAV